MKVYFSTIFFSIPFSKVSGNIFSAKDPFIKNTFSESTENGFLFYEKNTKHITVKKNYKNSVQHSSENEFL